MWRGVLRLLFVVIAAFLAGCGNLALVDSHDPTIEAGITEYQKSSSQFLHRVKQNPDGAHARYRSEEAQEFYASGSALLSTLITRADLLAPGRTCAPERARMLTRLVSDSLARQTESAATLDENSGPNLSLESSTCTGVAIRALKVRHNGLERIHKRRGTLDPFNAELVEQQIADGVRVALAIQRAGS